jgi:putative endonuclease
MIVSPGAFLVGNELSLRNECRCPIERFNIQSRPCVSTCTAFDRQCAERQGEGQQDCSELDHVPGRACIIATFACKFHHEPVAAVIHLVNSCDSNRAVVQLGRTLEWGSRGRGFKSRQPDVLKYRSMFHVYILRSGKAGRRYIGSCQDILERIHQRNSGASKATRHGIPWQLTHTESFPTRVEAVRKERYFKTGRGRDELNGMGRTVAAATGRGFKSRQPNQELMKAKG